MLAMNDPINNVMLENLRIAVTDIRQLVLAASDKQNLFDKVCYILVEKGKFQMVWIGMADLKTGNVTVAADHGTKGDYLENIDIRCDESPMGQGPTGRAIRHGLHQVNHDTEYVDHYAPWRDAARKLSFRSSAAFPFKVKGKVAGVINIYASEPYAFGYEEADLLDIVAELVGQTLEKIDKT